MKSLLAKMDFSKRRTYLLTYTLLFVIMALLIWSWFFFSGRTFIWQPDAFSDGLSQHYTALVYWAQYLREAARTLLEQHTLVLPQWDFTIGEGSDILETLQYYVIGDPFSLFSVFVPSRYMYVYYDAMILLRLYLAGMAFSFFCFQTGQRSRYAVLAGSMTYVFCYWALLNVARHPYFLNPMLYLPLLLLGVEKIIQGKRPYIFLAAVFLAGISNFYFFYMLTLLTLIYVVVRLIFQYRKNVKRLLLTFLKIVLPVVVGVLLAAAILLPMLYTFLGDARMSIDNGYQLFYPLSYYSSLPAMFLTPRASYWMCMGFAAPVLPAVILLFRQKGKNTLEKIYFMICLIIMVFPFFGQVFNGFSYMSNRWSFAFALLCAFILVRMWPSLMKLTKKDVRVLVIGVAAYFAVCLWFDYSRNAGAYTTIVLTLLFLFLLCPAKEGDGWLQPERKTQLAFVTLLASLFVNGFWLYSYGGDGYAAASLEVADLDEEQYANETRAVEEVAAGSEEEFYRYSGGDLTWNASVRAGLPSTQFYWTNANPYVSLFRNDLNLTPYLLNNYGNYDERSSLTTLASVLYYVVPEEDPAVPYGFRYVDTIDVAEQDVKDIEEAMKRELQVEELSEEQIAFVQNRASSKYDVYRNDNALPLAYTYEESIDAASFDSLSATEKQEALLQAVVLDEDAEETDGGNVEYLEEAMPYTVACEGTGITYSEEEGSVVVTAPNAVLTLSFAGRSNAETYVSLEGLTYTWTPRYQLYFGDETVDPLNLYNKTIWDQLSYQEKKAIRKERTFWSEQTTTDLTFAAEGQAEKTLSYGMEDYAWYNDRHDFVVNMGYSEDGLEEIRITFSQIGVYQFDSLQVICQPMDQYETQVSALKEDTLDDLEIGTDSVSGTISLDRDKILCFSIPYSSGWTAIVDGEETQLYRANIQYLALPLQAGDHTIRLEYRSPYVRTGGMVFCLGVILLVLTIIWEERRLRIPKQ